MEVPLLLKIAVAAAVGMAGGYAVSYRPESVPVPLADLTEHEADARLAAMVQTAFEEPISSKRIKKIRQIAAVLESRQFPGFVDRVWKEKALPEGVRIDLLADWAEVDLKGALAFAEALGGSTRGEAISAVVDIWAERDEAAVIAWIDSLPEGERRREAQSALLNFVGKNDLVRFLAMRRDMKMEWDDSSFRRVWIEWGYKDPKTALEESMHQAIKKDRVEAVSWVIPSICRSDANAAVEWVLKLPHGDERTNAIGSLVLNLAQNDPIGMLRLVSREEAGPDQINLRSLVVAQWVESDPNAALAYSASLPTITERNEALSSALAFWMQGDFNSGYRWLSENVSIASPEMLKDLMQRVLFQNSEHAMALTAFFPEGNGGHDAIYQNLGKRWTRENPEAAAATLANLPDGQLRDQFSKGFVIELSETKPAEAARVAMIFPTGESRGQLLANVMRAWAMNDPVTAIEWASKELPTGQMQDKIIAEAVAVWDVSDREAAVRYVEGLPAGPSRDRAANHLAHALFADDPLRAVNMAASFGDEGERFVHLDKLVGLWKKHDPAAALAWVEASNQPKSWKDKVLSK